MAGVAQQRNMRVKRLRALVTTAAGDYARAQHIIVTAATRAAAGASPATPRVNAAMTGVIRCSVSPALANSSGQLPSAAYRY